MSSYYTKVGLEVTAKDHRRIWDRTEYEIKAQERIAAEREDLEVKKGNIKLPKLPKVKREMLKPREYKVNHI